MSALSRVVGYFVLIVDPLCALVQNPVFGPTILFQCQIRQIGGFRGLAVLFLTKKHWVFIGQRSKLITAQN